MTSVGIEAINFFGGSAYLDVRELAEHRQLDTQRFDNLLMKQKTVALPYEDPVTFGANAAKPIVDKLSQPEKDRIEMVLTCTESAFDFGKSMSTYFHDLLGLNRNCRLFELKNACYSGTAGLQMAVNFVLSQVSPGAKVLVIATDITRFMVTEGGDALTQEWSFAEPSGGAGAVAMLISETPHIFQIDPGANGYYGYEVMDTCRPVPDSESGDADLSLLSYLDCYENSFMEYQKRVPGADYKDTFDFLAFHTPFGGMIQGAHRTMMRKLKSASPQEIAEDFEIRVKPGLGFCQRVGNIMGATSLLSLISTIVNADYSEPKRIGVYSYGSGCCAEFYSGVCDASGRMMLADMAIENQLDERYRLKMNEYDELIAGNGAVKFGTRNIILDNFIEGTRKSGYLYLKRIREFHREYEWA